MLVLRWAERAAALQVPRSAAGLLRGLAHDGHQPKRSAALPSPSLHTIISNLIRHGNSLALVIDKPILDLLRISEETLLEIETLDGKSLQIKPVKGTSGPRTEVRAALERTNKKFGKTLKNLAK